MKESNDWKAVRLKGQAGQLLKTRSVDSDTTCAGLRLVVQGPKSAVHQVT